MLLMQPRVPRISMAHCWRRARHMIRNPGDQVRVIKHLVKCGVSINETDKNGVTPLPSELCGSGVLPAVKEIIALGG